MIPCLNKHTLKLLVGTADERYSHSPEYFRKTHFPQVMNRYQGNQLIAEVTENELLVDLKEVDSSGNRVYLIFGSTGSGKSELLCWLKDKWMLDKIQRPVIRISRSELNPQVLIKKCYDVLNIPLNIHLDENRWDLLLKKPITLINQIVWSTLAESMESDEEIVPAALLLRPVIENNVIEFTKQVQRGRIRKPLEVLHREQFEELLSSTTIKLSLEYVAFRQTLSKKLDQFLFEGWDIASLFRKLTSQLKALNVRPLLLIDDLVQSVNIYATELLDQFITLEEGNWDVVIGLTPGAVQDSDRGADLAQRIQNLDTIHDRVKKLWLSDESGKDFYNLDRKQVVPYMANYLEQLKGSQGFVCSKHCPHFQDCSDIAQASNDTISESNEFEVKLLPFNRYMLKRTFDAIPLGKGKLRYMILNSKEIIRFFLRGNREHVTRIIPLIAREKFADHPDLFIKTFAEWFAPESGSKVVVGRQVLKHFGYREGETVVHLNNLGSQLSVERSVTQNRNNETNRMVHLQKIESIRSWVEGRAVNAELLTPVRLGVAAFVHDAMKGINMSRLFTPRTTSVIQRKETVNRTRYPISLGDHEEEGGVIQVSKGYASLQIANFQLLNYAEKEGAFQEISNDYEVAKWVYQGEVMHQRWMNALESALGMKVTAFAFGLKCWVQSCELYARSEWASGIRIYSPVNSELVNMAEQCYQDWFMLRDNLFQPSEHIEMTADLFCQWLTGLTLVKELENYQIGGASLYTFLDSLKQNYRKYNSLLQEELKKSIQYRMSMIQYLMASENERFVDYAHRIRQFHEKRSFDQKDFVSYTLLEQEMEADELNAQFAAYESLHKEVTQLNRQYTLLTKEIENFLSDCNIQVNVELNKETYWSNLEQEKLNKTVLVNELTKLRNCLAVSPSSSLKMLIHEKTMSPNHQYFYKLWSRLYKGLNQLILLQQPVGEDLPLLIAEWQAIDFYQLKSHVSNNLLKEQTKMQLLGLLQDDLKFDEISSVSQLLDLIENTTNIRPAIKRQIKLLMENGFSTLPPVQWRRLLDDLKETFPHLFKAVEIQLVAKHNQ